MIVDTDTYMSASPRSALTSPSAGVQLTCIQNIMNISGTWPDHMKPRKLPINTNVDTVLVLKDLILLICMADKGVHGYLRLILVQ